MCSLYKITLKTHTSSVNFQWLKEHLYKQIVQLKPHRNQRKHEQPILITMLHILSIICNHHGHQALGDATGGISVRSEEDNVLLVSAEHCALYQSVLLNPGCLIKSICFELWGRGIDSSAVVLQSWGETGDI